MKEVYKQIFMAMHYYKEDTCHWRPNGKDCSSLQIGSRSLATRLPDDSVVAHCVQKKIRLYYIAAAIRGNISAQHVATY